MKGTEIYQFVQQLDFDPKLPRVFFSHKQYELEMMYAIVKKEVKYGYIFLMKF